MLSNFMAGRYSHSRPSFSAIFFMRSTSKPLGSLFSTKSKGGFARSEATVILPAVTSV